MTPAACEPPDSELSNLDGTLIGGRYRLEARIGSGGMSTVHRAKDEKLERPVAVKLMHLSTAADRDHLERFRREARAVASLSHPNLVGVIDAGEDDGRPFIVLEYVAGENLKTRITRSGRLEVAEAVAYAIEIARGLSAAHSAGIVHRDVKPQNVLIDGEGRAKLTDFGIARTLDEDGLTADGRVIGTTDYVSPEQALGHPVDTSTDIYSLGVVLFEMLTGRVPFKAESPVGVAMCHVRDPMPEVKALRPEVSASLASIVDRCTAKDPSDRYQSLLALESDLEGALALEASRAGETHGQATTVIRSLPEPERKRVPLAARSRGFRILAALALLAATAVGATVIVTGIHRGTGIRGATPSGLRQVPLSAAAAHPYDPFGDGSEHDSTASLMLDGDRSTKWASETYFSGLQKGGVGVAFDAAPGVAARAMGVKTTTPGFRASVWGATGDLPTRRAAGTGPSGSAEPSDPPRGWVRLSPTVQVTSNGLIRLQLPPSMHRWYLLWVTDLAAADQKIELSEVTLLR